MDSPAHQRRTKRYKQTTPQSEAKCLFLEEDDEKKFKNECKAASSPLFLSPLGTKLVLDAEANGKPIDLLEINKKVIEHDVEQMIEEDKKVLTDDNDPSDPNKKDSECSVAATTDNAATSKSKKKDKKGEGKGDSCTKAPFIPHNSDDICDNCGLRPCESVTYNVLLQKAGDKVSKKNNNHNRATRHHLYKLYTATKYGKLGRSNRVHIPECVEKMVHGMFPDPNNDYTGFRHSIEDLNNDDYDRLMVDEQPTNYSDSSDDDY